VTADRRPGEAPMPRIALVPGGSGVDSVTAQRPFQVRCVKAGQSGPWHGRHGEARRGGVSQGCDE